MSEHTGNTIVTVTQREPIDMQVKRVGDYDLAFIDLYLPTAMVTKGQKPGAFVSLWLTREQQLALVEQLCEELDLTVTQTRKDDVEPW